MPRTPCLIALLGALCLPGCDRPTKSEPSADTASPTAETFTETHVEWSGASAEELKEEIRSMIPPAPLAVIRDGSAVLYHRGSVAEIQAGLDASSGRRPDELRVSPPVERIGAFPEPPIRKQEDRISLELDSDKAAAMGIPVGEIATQIRELGLEVSDPSTTEVLRNASIRSPSGAEVPLRSLVEIRPKTVTRPLILRQ